MYRSSRKKFFNRHGSFTSTAPAESPSRAGVDTLMVVPSRSGSKKRPPLASRGRESWPTTVVDVAQFSAVRGFITAVTEESISIQGVSGAPLEFSLSLSTVVTKVGRPTASAELAIGENVRVVVGTPGLATATSIDIELSHVVGRVVSINGVTLLISGRDGVLRTVVVGSSTAFLVNEVIATLDDVTIGSYVVVKGTYNAAASSLAARVVDMGRSRAASSLHDAAIQASSTPMSPDRITGRGESADVR